MRFTIVTPSFNQLDWLELCIASVADQQGVEFVEHIVQDAGTVGIEEFARRLGADFYQDGKKVFSAQCASWSPRRPVSSNLGSVDGEAEAVESGKVGAERSETDWSEATAAERARRRARSTLEGEKLNRRGYSLTIYSEKDAGMYDAVNKGLSKASGEICAYLNCDEQCLPGTLRWVADYLSVSPETEVLFGAAIVIRADGSYVCVQRVTGPTRWHIMVSGNVSILTSSTFFSRKAVVDRGLLFDPQWRVCADAVWVVQMLEAGLRIKATHKTLSAVVENGLNMSRADNLRAAEERRHLMTLAPALALAVKPAVLLVYRLRRWCDRAFYARSALYAGYTATKTKCSPVATVTIGPKR